VKEKKVKLRNRKFCFITGCRFKKAAYGLQLGEVADFEALTSNLELNFI